MARSRLGRWGWALWAAVAVGVFIVVALGAMGWVSFSPAGPAGQTASQTVATGGVAVTKSDITPVITLDATMAPRPTYVVSAPEAGVVTPGPGRPGAVVRAGAWLYSIGGRQIRASTDCTIQSWASIGVHLPAGLPVVQCTYPGFGLAAQVPAESAYTILSGDLRGKGEINNGPGPFDCPILSGALGADRQPGVSVVCAVPPNVRGIAGVGALLAIHSTLVKNALVLPRTSIRGAADSGVVGLIVNGRSESRTVTLGVSDGNVVQIVSGLSAGDRVTPTPPSLDGL